MSDNIPNLQLNPVAVTTAMINLNMDRTKEGNW